MEPRIETLKEKKLVGMHIRMSLADNQTFALWSGFGPRRREVKALNTDLFSLQVFPLSYDFHRFDPQASFEKWAAAEVASFDDVPEGMDTLVLPEGLYAVFIHKGPASEGERTFRYIFHTWLPSSGYMLDNRPHFELLGAKYKNNEPDSEEEVWIPIRSLE
ncbi:MAG: GyrI-like domain-containing protein [Flavobacteriales bacterium]|nr:GyrI-like domain-containing protein [Flavobacteriales bacterium]MCB9447147.1 GyrI-like domain-containing protein [Flavobacteriales bacterium]